MKIRKFLSCITACAVMSAIPVKRESSAAYIYWQDYYREAIDEFMKSDEYTERSKFSIADVTGDEMPELIISLDDCHAGTCRIYTVYDSRLIRFGKIGSNGLISYCPETNAVIDGFMGQGVSNVTYWHIKNNRMIEDCRLYNDAGAKVDEPAVYKINDEPVTKEEYDAARSTYVSGECVTLGRDYELTEADINYGFSGNWRDLYSDVFVNIRNEERNPVDYKFNLYDLNSDNIPEMFLFYDDTVTIYTVSDGMLYSLGRYSGDVMIYPELEIVRIDNYEVNYNSTSLYKYEYDMLKPVSEGSTNYSYFITDGNFTADTSYYNLFRDYSDETVVYIQGIYGIGEEAVDYGLEQMNINSAQQLDERQKEIYLSLIVDDGFFDYSGMKYNFRRFGLYDIDSDGVTELFINTPDELYVYTIKDDKPVMLEKLYLPAPVPGSHVAEIFYDTEKKFFSVSQGSEWWFSDGMLLQIDMAKCLSDEDAFMIDGNEASRDEYFRALDNHIGVNSFQIQLPYNMQNNYLDIFIGDKLIDRVNVVEDIMMTIPLKYQGNGGSEYEA